ncbi:hypothetical protein NP493_312g08007 [Ridgeia piscesae]|uniref:Uncharacterized protein n=1 Tax=Ridgeia piscesae TaxID=27915 RepID=A0AAD9L4Z3_RIDPI|nr:hypothetical protein NP493_312g08007 [Ridgeia piscesae]
MVHIMSGFHRIMGRPLLDQQNHWSQDVKEIESALLCIRKGLKYHLNFLLDNITKYIEIFDEKLQALMESDIPSDVEVNHVQSILDEYKHLRELALENQRLLSSPV